MTVVRQEYDGLQKEYSAGAATACTPEEGKTRQSDADGADINKILKRFEKSGILPLRQDEGLYLDVSEIPDYQGALAQVEKANRYFMSLPADSREMFENDPAVFLDAVNDPTQLDLLVKAGVIPKNEVKVPDGGAGAPSGDAAPGDVK